MSLTSSHDHQLYTPENAAIIFISHQSQMTFGVANINRADLINNVTLPAKATKLSVVTAMETEAFTSYIWPKLLDVFPGQHVIECTSMDFWDCDGFRKVVKATGRKNILLTGLWTEVCVAWAAIKMLGDGYNIHVAEDCCVSTSRNARKAALSRILQAGGTQMTTLGATLEFQSDWENKEHYDALVNLLRQQGGAYGVGVEYACTAVRHVSLSALSPQAGIPMFWGYGCGGFTC